MPNACWACCWRNRQALTADAGDERHTFRALRVNAVGGDHLFSVIDGALAEQLTGLGRQPPPKPQGCGDNAQRQQEHAGGDEGSHGAMVSITRCASILICS
jgi:hypothetical protein